MFSLSEIFPYQYPVTFTKSSLHATCPAELNFVTPLIFVQDYKTINLLINFLQSPVTSFYLYPNTALCTLFSNTLTLYFSCTTTDDVFSPTKDSTNHISQHYM